ncbi:MAG TPA: GNAT family N-acetyltransferase [Candidatus Nanoarchaeia archaeon]|nr:GNAT family N-acetyltransferase [Candidatus Nanoarchaeia archaeon]
MLQKNVKVRLTRNRDELKKVLEVRRVVFIEGQKVLEEREKDGLDISSKHAIVFYKNRVIGCARVRFLNEKVKLERIALLKNYRRKGIGNILMKYLITYSKKSQSKGIVMHAQYYLKNYYGRFGFKPKGRIFMDAGIRHIEMYLPLTGKKHK